MFSWLSTRPRFEKEAKGKQAGRRTIKSLQLYISNEVVNRLCMTPVLCMRLK